MTGNDNKWSFRSNFFFSQQCGVGINILKTKRAFLIMPEVIANSSNRCILNVCEFIQSLSRDAPLACLCINDPTELCKRYPQLTTEHCIEMRSGTSTVYALFIWSNQFYISDLIKTCLLIIFWKSIVHRILFNGKSLNCPPWFHKECYEGLT